MMDVDLEGIPQIDRPEGGTHLRPSDYEAINVRVEMPSTFQAVRRAYKRELQALLLLYHRDGMRRVYCEADDREYLIDDEGLKLAAIWIAKPVDAAVVIIRTEQYAVPITECDIDGQI